MSHLFRFPHTVERDAAIEHWMREHATKHTGEHSGALGTIARRWFDVMRNCGDEVRELLHDGHPTACVGDAAFAYVDAFRHHVNVGFFRGADLPDPTRLLEGNGVAMRHVKVRANEQVDAVALTALIEAAFQDMKERVETG